MPDDPTFDLELPDTSAAELAVILSGISKETLYAIQAAAANPGDPGPARHLDVLDGLTARLLTENREAARHLFLESDAGEFLKTATFPDETLDDLGLELVDGQLYDTEGMTDIEVE